MNNDYTNVIKSLWKWPRIQNTEQTENTETTERRKTSFPRVYVQIADLHKPVCSKIMTTHR